MLRKIQAGHHHNSRSIFFYNGKIDCYFNLLRLKIIHMIISHMIISHMIISHMIISHFGAIPVLPIGM